MAVTHRSSSLKWRDAMGPAISRYGAMAAVAASLTVLVSGYIAVAGEGCPLILLGALYAAGAAEIIVLCRVVIPTWLQMALILAIIGSLTTLTARTDVFGIQHVDAAIPGAAGASLDRSAIAATSGHPAGDLAPTTTGGGSGNGAQVAFEPASSGDDGWAKMLNSAYDRHLGGPQASRLIISGNVGARRIGKDTSVQVNWGVSTDDTSVHCGSTSAYGSDYPALSEQIRQGLGQAISRSLELQRPSCQ